MAKSIFTLKNRLPLVITTGILAGTSAVPVIAASAQLPPDSLSADKQWRCDAHAGSEGWNCQVVPRQPGALPFVARAPLSPAFKEKPATTVTVINGNSSAQTSAQAVTSGQGAAAASVLPLPAPAAGTKLSESVRLAFQTLDWQQLPAAEQNSRTAQVCHGDYREPSRPGLNFSGNPNREPIYAEANNSQYNDNGQGVLSGHVVIRQGYRQIESDVARINRATGETSFSGNVVIREPNTLLVGQKADINLDSGRTEITDAQYVLHQQRIRGAADTIIRKESGVVEMDNASYTTCPPDGCIWQLNGKEVELNPISGFGTATHATLDILNVPVFYIPTFSFPIDDRRKSGLLYSTFAFGDSDTGLDYTQPIYWNIAPNLDATITPRIMTKRGVLLENEFRYLTPSARGTLGGAWMSKDKLKKDNLNKDENRWFFTVQHKQSVTDNWTYRINYTDASDREYFKDFGTSVRTGSTSPLVKEINTTYNGGDGSRHQWQLSAGYQKLENMAQNADDPYSKKPHVALKGNWDIGDISGLAVSYLFDYSDFYRDKNWKYREQQTDKKTGAKKGVWEKGTGINNAIGKRLYAETGVKYRFNNSYSFIEPGIKLRSVRYDLDRLDQKYINSTGKSESNATRPETTAPTLYLDSGLTFERPTGLAGLKFTQTLEPRARYTYTPYRKDQGLNPTFDTSAHTFSYSTLWQDDRFRGHDRIGDTNQLALGVTSRFIDETGFERFRFGMGQVFYFKDRKTFIDPRLNKEQNPVNKVDEKERRIREANKASTSPLATQLVWFLRKDLRLTQDWMYNTNQGHNQEYAVGMQYLPKPGSVVNLRYRYQDLVKRAEKNKLGNNTGRFVNGNMEEADFSLVWPVSPTWSLLSRWTYDITNNRHMERSFGLEQDSCCYMVRAMYRNWIDPDKNIDTAEQDQGIFFEFVLKGLGNIAGSKVDGFLQNISGYTSRKD